MDTHPQFLVVERIDGHTCGASAIVVAREGPDEHQLIGSREKHETDDACYETTRDVWLFEPLFGEKECGVDTFESDQRCDPEWDAQQTSQAIAKYLTTDMLISEAW